MDGIDSKWSVEFVAEKLMTLMLKPVTLAFSMELCVSDEHVLGNLWEAAAETRDEEGKECSICLRRYRKYEERGWGGLFFWIVYCFFVMRVF